MVHKPIFFFIFFFFYTRCANMPSPLHAYKKRTLHSLTASSSFITGSVRVHVGARVYMYSYAFERLVSSLWGERRTRKTVDEIKAGSTQRSTAIFEAAHAVSINAREEKQKGKKDGEENTQRDIYI